MDLRALHRSTSFRLAGLLTVLVAAVGMSACGSDQSSSSTASATAASIGFHPNREVYALPMDQIRAVDDGSIGYAANVLVQDCMEKAGFSWPIPSFDPTVRPPATWNSTGRRLFDVQIAEQFGYHLAPPPDAAAGAEAAALNARSLSPTEERRVGRCRSTTARRVSPPDTRLVDSLAGAAYDSALAEADTVAAARAWKSCLAPEGISDLPDAPNKMPSPSLARRFHLGRAGAASSDEIRVATADAKCRESSGYAKVLYDDEVEQQLELFASNRDALDRARAAATQNLKRARAVMAQHGS